MSNVNTTSRRKISGLFINTRDKTGPSQDPERTTPGLGLFHLLSAIGRSWRRGDWHAAMKQAGASAPSPAEEPPCSLPTAEVRIADPPSRSASLSEAALGQLRQGEPSLEMHRLEGRGLLVPAGSRPGVVRLILHRPDATPDPLAAKIVVPEPRKVSSTSASRRLTSPERGDYELGWLDRRMVAKIVQASSPESVGTGIGPDVRAVAPEPAHLDVIAIGASPTRTRQSARAGCGRAHPGPHWFSPT